jgi:hypothetical protein
MLAAPSVFMQDMAILNMIALKKAQYEQGDGICPPFPTGGCFFHWTQIYE